MNGAAAWRRPFLVAASIAFVAILFSFAVRKAALGVDFTDEGLYAVAPWELAKGAAPYPADLMTVWHPFCLVSQLLFKMDGSLTLYQLRLCGWSLHILAYLVLALALCRRFSAVVIPFAASAASFFISFAWPSAIATPSYNSLSSDFLLLFLCCYHVGDSVAGKGRLILNWSAGAMLLLAVVCYPTLLVVAALFVGFDCSGLWASRPRALGPASSRAHATAAFALLGVVLLAFLWSKGSLGFWLARLDLIRSAIPGNFAPQARPLFVVRLFHDLFTGRPEFGRYAVVSACSAVAVIAGRKWRLSDRFGEAALLGLGAYGIYLVEHFYGDDSELGHFFFPTAYCVVAVSLLIVFSATQAFGARRRGGAENACLALSGVACIVFAASTHYFSYYYSWNAGLRALPFAFTLLLMEALTLRGWPGRIASVGVLLGLLQLAYIGGRYNYYGVRRDSPVAELRYPFEAPALRGVRSSKERVDAVDALYEFMKSHEALGGALVAYNDCPMVYFILGCQPAYGMCWARNDTISLKTQRWLADDMLSRPLPRYALRAIADPSDADWRKARAEDYREYPLNEVIERNYSRKATIYPFDVYELKGATGAVP
jgi:hypothetical protein